MELWVGAICLGLVYAFTGIGIFITFRVHNFPDITVDGSFTLGAAVGAVLIASGANPFVSILAAFVAAALAGVVTAAIHTKLNVNGLLAGILVMTGLYSVNLHVMARSNIPLLDKTTCFTYLQSVNPGMHPEVWTCCGLVLLNVLFWLLMTLFLKTDYGITMRAVGNNPDMAAANGVHVNAYKTFGLALANGFAGVSGCLVAQYQGFADIGMGIGTVLMGLAAVIIGESVISSPSVAAQVFGVLLGSVIFRLMIAFALSIGMNPIDLKLLTAFFVLLTLVISAGVARGKGEKGGVLGALGTVLKLRRFRYVTAGAVLAILAFLGYRHYTKGPLRTGQEYRIGVVQYTSHEVLDSARDGFVAELKRLGYQPGQNCKLQLENANGDMPTVSSIIDKFNTEKLDIVVTISTPCTQAAINKITDRPIVFTTVANPFVIGAGKTETDHLPNVTGAYGEARMDKIVNIVHTLIPRKLKVGTIWNPALANSVVHLGNLKKALASCPDYTLVETTVTSTSEVYEAANALNNKGAELFLLISDNTVFSAFDSVMKVARRNNIPVFLSNLDRLQDGTLGCLGFDFSGAGAQGAQLVDRILKGEKPSGIPFEHYRDETFGLNLDAAKNFGITIPDEFIKQATFLHKDGKRVPGPAARKAAEGPGPAVPGAHKRIALLVFNDNIILRQTIGGVMEELEKSGVLRKYNMTVDTKSAQGEFAMAQSIAQDFVRQQYDYIITISTPALQVTAQVNKKIPHVFGAVTDPYRMGVAKTSAEHQPNLTGVASFQPIAATVALMRKVLPNAKRIGIVWNPAEACSEACTYKTREVVKDYGFELIEATVSGTGEVPDALRSVLGRKVDIFFTSGDNTVNLARPTIAQILREKKIPYFTNAPNDVLQGSCVSIGADYVEVGRETGRMAVRVINGEDPRTIPIKDYVPKKIAVNLPLAREIGITIPEDVVKQAESSEKQP
ncbi:MAG: hypothetical protein NTW87_17915 [Planctomycetota bacterium]|nr:hypothetical protein [Planctomycetota bacterium]